MKMTTNQQCYAAAGRRFKAALCSNRREMQSCVVGDAMLRCAAAGKNLSQTLK